MEREERTLNSLKRIRDLLKEAHSEAVEASLIFYYDKISSLIADLDEGIERIETEKGGD